MLFNSYLFILLFLPVSLLGFVLCARASKRAAAGWLTLTSLIFYGYWNPPYVLILMLSIVANYLIGSRISAKGGGDRWLTVLGVTGNLLLLGYYKYANFFVDNVAAVSGTGWEIAPVLLPIGISFYTFTQIAYLIDCHRGLVREYDLLNYALFVSFFPQLIAGPILHHKEMMPQFQTPERYRLTAENMAVGSTIFIIGLFKKAVLADGIAVYANPVFIAADAAAGTGSPLTPDLFAAWGAALAYTFQLYFDFSGYSDMAIGLARMFGIVLPLNFASPYKSTSISQFWRTWHMTLSRFLRDYLYIPLGGNRKGPVRRYINLFLTMLLGGFWHGAGWNFAIWGALHGAYLIVDHGGRHISRGRGDRVRLYRASTWLLTFVAVIIGWVFFRAVTLEGAVSILAGMAGMNGAILPGAIASVMGPVPQLLGMETSLGGGGQFVSQWLWIIALFAIAIFAPNTQDIMQRARPALDYLIRPIPALLIWQPNARWAVTGAVLAVAGMLSLTRVSEFLYFQF